MNIHAAITHLQAGRCVCKHLEQTLEKLSRLVEEGFHHAKVTFGTHLVILETGAGREVLCSYFLEQRD